MPIEAVLWDLDGVLADSGEIHYQAWKKILTPTGYPFSREIFSEIFGMNNTTAVRTMLGADVALEEIRRIDLEKEAIFREMVPGNLKLLPGAEDWLRYFQACRIPQVVASSAPDANFAVMMRELGISGYFKALISGSRIPGKPAPDVFLLAAQRIGVEPARCVVIEDSTAGVEAANRAGMKCVAVLTTTTEEKLRQATLILPSLEDLSPNELETRLWPDGSGAG